MRKPTFWFPTWSDKNQAVQLQLVFSHDAVSCYIRSHFSAEFSSRYCSFQLKIKMFRKHIRINKDCILSVPYTKRGRDSA